MRYHLVLGRNIARGAPADISGLGAFLVTVVRAAVAAFGQIIVMLIVKDLSVTEATMNKVNTPQTMSIGGRRIVLTGGPHSGKTTLLQYLKGAGHSTVSEAALLLIENLNVKMGITEQIRWRKENRAEFQDMVARLQIELEAQLVTNTSEFVFFDRGLLDGLAYCEASGVEPPKVFSSVEMQNRYDGIFVLQTIVPFEQRSATGRMSDEQNSIRLSQYIFDTYTKYGYRPVWISQCSVEERVGLVFRHLNDVDHL